MRNSSISSSNGSLAVDKDRQSVAEARLVPATRVVLGPCIPVAHREAKGAPRSRPLLRILVFFCLLAVLAFALDAIFSCGLRRVRTSELGSFNRVMSGKVNAEIVINGSSRATAHYDPRVIQRLTGKATYNLGRNGSQTDMQLAILKAYLNHNARPETVVQNLDLFSLVVTHEGEIYDPGFYMPYLYDHEIYHAVHRTNPGAWKSKYIPLYGYAVEDLRFTWVTGLKGFFGIYPREDFFLGYNPRDVVWTGDFQRFKADRPSGVRFSTEIAGAQALKELIEVCQRRGIQVILVYSPEYSEMQALEIDRAKIIGRFHEIAENYNVPFWDYSDSELCRRREYFQNSQHLNRAGAEAFTTELANRLASEHFHVTDAPERLEVIQAKAG